MVAHLWRLIRYVGTGRQAPIDAAFALPFFFPPAHTPGMQALLLVDHGSRRAASNAQLEQTAELVRASLPPTCLVAFAHMELAEPTIAASIDALVARGATSIVVVPYFLSPGRHSQEDIPRMVREAASAHSRVSVTTADCLGIDGALAGLVVRRARSAGFEPDGP